jgi:tetratricopeptide (TPR) repeat protein
MRLDHVRGLDPYQAIRSRVVEGLAAPTREEAERAFLDALEAARAQVASSPDDAEAHYLLDVALGYHLEHRGIRTKLRLAAEVRAAAEHALELDPRHAGAHHVLGRLHAGAMRLDRLERLVVREVLGGSVLEGASWERAEAYFLEALRLEPSNPRHGMELGSLYLDTHRRERAREILSAAAALPAREAADSLALARVRSLLAELAERR